jgi:hypothetical protein
MKTDGDLWQYLAEFLLQWEMFRTIFAVEIKTHILCSIALFFFENRAVYEIMWKNIVQPDRPQVTICLIRISCWITKVPHTITEYVLVIAFPLQQWLHERASLLCCTYIACLVHSDVCHLQKMRRISSSRRLHVLYLVCITLYEWILRRRISVLRCVLGYNTV